MTQRVDLHITLDGTQGTVRIIVDLAPTLAHPHIDQAMAAFMAGECRHALESTFPGVEVSLMRGPMAAPGAEETEI